MNQKITTDWSRQLDQNNLNRKDWGYDLSLMNDMMDIYTKDETGAKFI